jgi:hypothetical protein
MRTYKHSGTLGDLIYSLYIVKKMGGGLFNVAIENLERCVKKYGYLPEHIDNQHRGRFTQQDFNMLLPLLKRQNYITGIASWKHGMAEPDVDLDRFRGVLFREFEGNYIEAYHRTFGLPFSIQDYDTPWLESDPIKIAPIVVSRTARYRDPNGTAIWTSIVKDVDLPNNGVFVGTEVEHKDFTSTVGVDIPYYKVNDFLELSNIVAGAELVMANQNFVYSLAMGLGKDSILETMKMKPLLQNECFFPRTNIQYV